ncbi:MAG: VOC family protein [Pseudorhodoplanes sp.]|uniref:VOC family protein n=1 Tax=Pseudorhodoplanes sp. TaxID=1934341 RepID=UPI003D1382CD
MTQHRGSAVIPCLTYREAPRMLQWLCEAFGFERHAVYDDDAGGISHAELTLGSGMIMLGSEQKDGAFAEMQSTPARLKGTTQSPYLVVRDADEVFTRVVALGGEIVIPIEDRPYGGRAFSCRDPEGHLWNVGSYDPWASKS